MGKARKPRLHYGRRMGELGVPPPSEPFEDLLNRELAPTTGPVEAVRDQLQSANIEEKLNGLQSLAVLAGDAEKVAAICGTDVVRIAAPLLCERDQAVRNACAGALRNISVTSSEVCDYLVKQDVLTPLEALLREYLRDVDWRPSFDASMGGQVDLHSDTFLQAVSLMWHLCESSALAVEIMTQPAFLEPMLRLLDHQVYGLEIAMAVAQCLLVVTESNTKSWIVLNDHVAQLIRMLTISGEGGELYLRTIVVGILTNVPALSAAHAVPILSSLADTLAVDHNAALLQAIELSLEKQEQQRTPGTNMEIHMDEGDTETDEAAARRRRREELPTETEIALRNVGYLIDAQRLAGEIITNICSTDEDEWSDVEEDEEDDMSDGETIVDCDSLHSGSGTNLAEGDQLPADTVEAVKSLQLVDKIWQKAKPLEDNVTKAFRRQHYGLQMKAGNLRISALLCIQNICNVLSTEDLGGANAIYNVWVHLGEQVFNEKPGAVIIEPITSLMRSILSHLKTNQELFVQMTESDLELMLAGFNNCGMAEVRANWLRMLGTLGCILAEELVKKILVFILDTCAQEQDIWPIAEGMDSIMDIFANNDWENIVKEINLVQHIKVLEKTFKAKMRQQRRSLNQRYPAVQTVHQNLLRFVKHLDNQRREAEQSVK